MNMTKDVLKCMATVLRENGYKVSLKKSDTKKPYVSNKFNKICDLDLKSLDRNTCLFLDDFTVEDIESGDNIVSSSSVTLGYLNLSGDDDADDINIETNRTDSKGYYVTEKLKKYDYVIKLKDVIKLMVNNDEFTI